MLIAILAAGCRGGPRSGASLFLRPNRVAPASTYRPSFDDTLHTMSRTYSISEVPTLEDAASGRLPSEAALPLLDASPPLAGLHHAPEAPAQPGSTTAKAAEHVGSLTFAEEKSAAKAPAKSLYTACVYGFINAIVGARELALCHGSCSQIAPALACGPGESQMRSTLQMQGCQP